MSKFAHKCSFALIAIGLCNAHPASAWGPGGHQQIADIAFTRLTPATKKHVQAILFAGDPQFRPHDASDEELRRAFRQAATLPDVIKGNHNTIYEIFIDQENLTFPFEPGTSDNEKVRCKTWHYFDTPIPATAGRMPLPTESNALAALPRIKAELQSLAGSNLNKPRQAWDLCWIEHLVGDLHQPLHCASSFKLNASGDDGGNGFKLGLKHNGKPMTLHALWDGGIDQAASDGADGDFESVTAAWTDPASFANIQPSSADVDNLDTASWIKAGAKLAEEQVYVGISPGGKPDSDYETKEDLLCEKQAVLAGYRLAKMLNAILGQ